MNITKELTHGWPQLSGTTCSTKWARTVKIDKEDLTTDLTSSRPQKREYFKIPMSAMTRLLLSKSCIMRETLITDFHGEWDWFALWSTPDGSPLTSSEPELSLRDSERTRRVNPKKNSNLCICSKSFSQSLPSSPLLVLNSQCNGSSWKLLAKSSFSCGRSVVSMLSRNGELEH